MEYHSCNCKVSRGQRRVEYDLHFHMLVYKRVVRWKVGSKDPGDMLVRNWLTSPYLWLLSLFTIIPAALFWDDTVVLAFCFFGFAFLYTCCITGSRHFACRSGSSSTVLRRGGKRPGARRLRLLLDPPCERVDLYYVNPAVAGERKAGGVQPPRLNECKNRQP